MSYIGNSSNTQSFTPAVDYFSGNGVATSFTLSRSVGSTAQIQVIVNNVIQNPSTAYTVLNNTLTFTGAPSSGTNNVYVYYTSPVNQSAVIPQSPQIVGDTITGGGVYSKGAFSNAFTSGLVADYSGSQGRFSVGSSAGFGFYNGGVANTALVTIDQTGKLGVGTTSPGYLLDVSGQARIGGANGWVTGVGTAFQSGQPEIYSVSTNPLGIGTTGAAALHLYTNSTLQTTISSAGYVGIGTSSPSTILHVNQSVGTAKVTLQASASGTPGVGVEYLGATTATNWLTGGNYNIGGAFEITPSTTVGGSTFSTPAVLVNSSGFVGIGTSSPTNRLVVSNSGAMGLEVNPTAGYTGITGVDILSYNRSTSTYGGIGFVTNASNNSMVILNNGYVGIGTPGPSSPLHVLSNTNASTILQTSSQSFQMFGKVIQSYNNATATALFSFVPSTNCGIMVKIMIRGTSAVAGQMYEDVAYAFWWGVGGGYNSSSVTSVSTVTNITGSHTVGTLSWTNANSRNPTLNYTQGNNGYILEALDVFVTARDGANVTFNSSYQSFG